MKPHLVDFTLNKSKPWVLAFLPGQRTKNGSADTLKKQWAGLLEKAQGKLLRGDLLQKARGKADFGPSFVQVLPARVATCPTHLEWVGFALVKSLETDTLHFRQPDLEFLARAAGTFQWKDVLANVTLQPKDKDVVLVWMGPKDEWDAKTFVHVAKEWGLVVRNAWPKLSEQEKVFALERSALVALE